MLYCIYNYTVRHKDGIYKSGAAPYYGDSVNEALLVRHVKTFFAGCPEFCEEIKVAIIDKPKDEIEFLKEARYLKSFDYLRTHHNFGAEMISRHFPEESYQSI